MSPLIRRYTLGGVAPGPWMPITAGIHCDEFEPIVTVWQRSRVTLIAVANPAAFV